MQPVVSERLLKHLREAFPNVLPENPKVNIEDLRLLQGEQRVIRFLERMNEEQETT